MEGETGIIDPAVCLGRVEKLLDTQSLDSIPKITVEAMKKVIIDAIGLQLFQLCIQELVHVHPLFDEPCGKFCGEPDLLAISIRKSPAYERLALSHVVRPCRVDVIDSIVDCEAELSLRPLFVDRPIRFCGKTHAPEPEYGEFVPVLWHFPI